MQAMSAEAASRPAGKPRSDARTWVEELSAVASPPGVCVRVLELIESPDASAQDIGLVIRQDPNLTARLLRLVNSSFYGYAARVDTVPRAISLVGMRELHGLVVAISAVQTFAHMPTQLVNMDTFWRHSIYCGLIARALAHRCRVLHGERLFVAGLLHDIGSLILYSRAPETAAALLERSGGSENGVSNLEREIFGFSHADVGALLLERWQLPEHLRAAVAWHHDPEHAGAATLDASIVHIADVLANRSGIGSFAEHSADADAIAPAALEALGMNAADLDEEQLIGDAGLQFTETVSLLFGK